MNIKEQFFALRDEYVRTEDPERKAELDRQITQLLIDNPEQAPTVYKEAIEDTIQSVRVSRIKEQLEDVWSIIPIAYIAKNYFQKSSSWLSQRLNGNVVAGRRMSLKDSEIIQLEDALHSIGDKFKSIKLS